MVVADRIQSNVPACIENGDLPVGWALSPIQKLCGVNPPKPARDALSADGDVTFVPMPAVDADSGAITNPDVRPFASVRKGYTAFAENDVIVAKITPCMENGKAAIARGLANGIGFGSTEFHVLRSRGAVLPEYIYRFVRQESFRRDAEMVMTGSVGQKRVPANFIENAPVPLPPLAEQERIVEAVELLAARVDSARQRLANVPKILKRFRQAVLAAACTGRLTEVWRETHASTPAASELLQMLESRSSKTARLRLGSAVEPDPTLELPTGWIWSPLNLLCDEIVDCPHSTPKWTESGRLCVRTTNFKPGYLDLSSQRYVSDDTFRERISRLRPEPDDLLYSREGGILGIACLIPPQTQLCLGQRMMLIRAWPEVSALYVMHCLNSSIVLQCVGGLTGGTASPHLNVGDIKQFQMPLPPTPEQQEIVRRVASLMKLANAIERRVAAATARADKITQAILAKAFRGELVPTEAELARAENRMYETASELLARVAASADANEPLHPRRTRRKRT